MNNISEIKKHLAEHWSAFESLLSSTLDSQSDMLNRINRYLFDTSGKQIRPLLAFVSAMAGSGVINEQTVACATASELIHTASLLHDDVVDNSEQRRGNKTVSKLFSPGASILIGDFWLTRALALLLEKQCPNEVLRCYAGTLEELAEGEMMQMDFADSLTTAEKDYLNIIRRKTGSLFVASVRCAAIVSGATSEIVNALTEYAHLVGISFQIRDDIIDYYPSSETGKDSGCDIEERKITMPLLCAMESDPSQAEFIRSQMGKIVPLAQSQEQQAQNKILIEQIKEFVYKNNGLESAKVRLGEILSQAKESLGSLSDSYYKDALLKIADSLLLS
ncbi:MAG: polyprenyl synthetase family protein [Bacteroidales bacterium]|jgi:octaprenyl-diphosphate synthase|nr:polyprenyl synthetase family protein [Bacteroidales bacterium]